MVTHDIRILPDEFFCAVYVIMILPFGFNICSALEPFSGCLSLFTEFRELR